MPEPVAQLVPSRQYSPPMTTQSDRAAAKLPRITRSVVGLSEPSGLAPLATSVKRWPLVGLRWTLSAPASEPARRLTTASWLRAPPRARVGPLLKWEPLSKIGRWLFRGSCGAIVTKASEPWPGVSDLVATSDVFLRRWVSSASTRWRSYSSV